MPFSVRWQGQSHYRPGAYTHTDLSGLRNLNLGSEASILIIGEADAGQPQETASTPVYSLFTSQQQMIDTFLTGNLAECAKFAFDPAMDGQLEDGVPLRGCDRVYAIKTNVSTQASYTLQDASSNDALTIKDKLWGLPGNQTWFKVEVADTTGINITMGRENAPNIGSQVSSSFSVTDVDEWFSIGVTAQFTGATCTVAFDGTTITLNSDVALEDTTITCTNKTIQAIIAEINAFDPHGTGAVYEALSLRNDRTATTSTYLDVIGTPQNIEVTPYKLQGVAYDIVEWVNANSVYCDATWVAGYEPQTYTQRYLDGGATGDTTSTTIQEALKTAKKFGCRFVVSAFDTDAGAGGAIALTTINNYFTTHANQCNPIGGRAERQVFMCADSTTKAALWTELGNYNNAWAVVVADQLYREGPDDVITWLGTHCTATAAAAIKAGSPIGTPLTQRYVKAHDHRPVATDFDPNEDVDFENGIKNGLLFLETDPDVGIRFAKGITTYTTEDNDGYTYIEVVEEQLWLHRVIRRNVERPFIGHKGRGNRTVQEYKSLILSLLRALADPSSPDMILVSGTDAQGNAVPAYRNVVVYLTGDQIYLEADITFAQGINFIFNKFRATLPTALAA